MSWLDKLSYASFNWKAPKGMPEESINEVLFPVAKSQTVDGSEAVEIDQMVNFVDLGELSGNVTLNLAIDGQVSAGALLRVKAKSDTTARTVTLGTGLEGTSLAGTISKTKVQTFLYDGVSFVPLAVPFQLD